MTDRIELTLTFPPSTNHLYFNVSKEQRAQAAMRGRKLPGRLKSKDLVTWIRANGYVVNAAHQKAIEGRYWMVVGYSRDHGTKRKKVDLSNHLKAIEDLLVEHRLIEDDSLSEDIRMYWDDSLPPRTCFVQIGAAA